MKRWPKLTKKLTLEYMMTNQVTTSEVVYTQGPYGNIDVEGRREQFTKYLREGVIKVGFTKKNGEDRVINCTLINIPADKQPKGEAPERKGTSLAVFDVDKQDWRSFNLENVYALEANGETIFGTVGK